MNSFFMESATNARGNPEETAVSQNPGKHVSKLILAEGLMAEKEIRL
jgi:hypothetical protein